MQRYSEETIEWLEFDLLAGIPNLKHGVFLRTGGSSGAPFASLNTSYLIGDCPKRVTANLAKITAHLTKQLSQAPKTIWGRGCHGTFLAEVNHLSETEILHCDGLLSKNVDIALLMKHADCQIALFYDPMNQCIANVHAGWRGSVQNIFAHTIEQMKGKFGTDPANLFVCISPSLGPEKAEFVNYKQELPEEFWQFQVQATYFDLWTISEYQLQNSGVLPHHIEIARLCTYCNPHDFFSYRREQVTGRHATYIALTSSQ